MSEAKRSKIPELPSFKAVYIQALEDVLALPKVKFGNMIRVKDVKELLREASEILKTSADS